MNLRIQSVDLCRLPWKHLIATIGVGTSKRSCRELPLIALSKRAEVRAIPHASGLMLMAIGGLATLRLVHDVAIRRASAVLHVAVQGAAATARRQTAAGLRANLVFIFARAGRSYPRENLGVKGVGGTTQ